MKPPQGLALMKFSDGFNPEMAYQLREKDLATLEEMQRSAVCVEENLIAKRARMRSGKIVMIKEEPVASTSYAKIDIMMRTMERIMERINLNERTVPRENQPSPQNRNQNVRRNPPQIRQREQRGLDHQIRPSFQENYVDEDEGVVEEPEQSQINLMGINDEDTIFLTEEEPDVFSSTQTAVEIEDYKDYKQGFKNSIMELHRQYNLRSKKNSNIPKRNNSQNSATKAPEVDPKKETESSKKITKITKNNDLERNTSRPTVSPRKTVLVDIPNTSQQSQMATKVVLEKSDSNLPKTQTPFSIENEIAKVKISLPLTELVNQDVYRS